MRHTAPLRPSVFVPVKTRQTGRLDCTEAEIQEDLFLARNFRLPKEGFQCIAARRRFLAERNVKLLSRRELSLNEQKNLRADETFTRAAVRALDTARKAVSQFKLPGVKVALGGAAVGALVVGGLVVALLVFTRGT